MNSYVSQSALMGTSPVVANHLNITKPPAGEPTLLTFDEVTTMFHEFGHALHGLFSQVEYPYFSGTSVPRDFVEYPSQVNEMWATWPEVLENYAVHYETGEAMPRELLDKVLSTQTFNQGFATTEYLAASIVDQALHQLTVNEVPSSERIMDFEAQALEAAGIQVDEVPLAIARPISHILSGATRRAIIPTSGARCWTQTPWSGFAKMADYCAKMVTTSDNLCFHRGGANTTWVCTDPLRVGKRKSSRNSSVAASISFG